MRILVINTNRTTQPYPVMPIGLASVATTLERAGHDVRLLDLCFAPSYETAIRDAIAASSPELVGLSVRNLDNSDLIDFTWFLPEIRDMVRVVTQCTGAPIVAGGSAVSVMPVEVLGYLGCDLGVIGDGEQAILELAERLGHRDPSLPHTPGVVARHDGGWIVNPKQPILEYDLFGTTQLHRWVDVQEYIRHGSIFPIQSNRGCAFHCIYCTYTLIEGKRYRLRPPELVAREIAEAQQHAGVNYFEFVDSVFNVPEAHAQAVCRAIIDAGIRARFGAAGINPRWLTPELLTLMERAGFASLDITIESASEPMLVAMQKGFRRADVLAAADRVRRSRLKILWVLLLGGPGETLDTLEESFAFVREQVRPSDVVYITSGIRLYPHTPLAETALRDGLITGPGDLVRPTFYLSEAIGFETMRERVLALVRERPNVVASFEADEPWVPAAYRLLSRVRAPQPYWRYAPLFNRLKRWRTRWARPAAPAAGDFATRGSYYLQGVPA